MYGGKRWPLPPQRLVRADGCTEPLAFVAPRLSESRPPTQQRLRRQRSRCCGPSSLQHYCYRRLFCECGCVSGRDGRGGAHRCRRYLPLPPLPPPLPKSEDSWAAAAAGTPGPPARLPPSSLVGLPRGLRRSRTACRARRRLQRRQRRTSRHDDYSAKNPLHLPMMRAQSRPMRMFRGLRGRIERQRSQ